MASEKRIGYRKVLEAKIIDVEDEAAVDPDAIIDAALRAIELLTVTSVESEKKKKEK